MLLGDMPLGNPDQQRTPLFALSLALGLALGCSTDALDANGSPAAESTSSSPDDAPGNPTGAAGSPPGGVPGSSIGGASGVSGNGNAGAMTPSATPSDTGGTDGAAGMSTPTPPLAGGGGNGSGAASSACKRGLASNDAPGADFFPGLGWWYAWSSNPPGGDNATDIGIEFVPMIWDEGALNATLPPNARFLLGFNEPNFGSQADLTAEQAASFWPELETLADQAALPLVSPAVNFCGGDCNGTDPYQYLRDFFAACTGCRVDFVAVHWYNCDLPSLTDYLEPGGALEGFEQFQRPIWLTEFACLFGADTSVAAQEAYLREAVPYLESNPNIFRYSWFSADPLPEAIVMNADGSPNALGQVYLELEPSCL